MKNAFFYFIIFPFYGLIQAIKNYRLPWAKNMVWLFVVFYGYTMYRPDGVDSTRYIVKLQRLYEEPRTWDTFIGSFYSIDEGGGSVDIYEPIMVNFVSLFSNLGNVLFAFYGLVFGYFYSRNIWFLIDEIKIKQNAKYIWVLLFAFVCIIGFWELNGVRMWTAAQVFFFGVYTALMKNEKKGVLIVLSSVLIHFSFALPIGLFLTYYFFKIPWRFLYIIFISSFFVSLFNVTVVSTFLENNLPTILLPRVKSYTSDVYVETYETLNNQYNWYIKYSGMIINYAIAFLLSVIYFSKNRKYLSDKKFLKFLSFATILLTAGNFLAQIPSGERYLILAQFTAMASLVIYYVRFEQLSFKKATLIVTPFLLFFIVISIRKSFDSMSLMTLFTNPVLATLFDAPIPLIDLIK
jgi:hypothetical protein